MAVTLNHTIVHSDDPQVTATFMTELLGLPTATRFGPFLVVEVANGVSLDVMQAERAEIQQQHYAFLVSEAEFDEIYGRIVEWGIDHWADPGAQHPGEINHHDGGRGVYFAEPSGHYLEIITRPYGSGSPEDAWMKSFGGLFSSMASAVSQRNMKIVAWLLVVFAVLVVIFSAIFHELMAREGREHSFATGIYWTLTVMSTLGFGDITFESDAGRIFSVVVLMSGALLILVLLPFVFIQFLFMPWVAWREANRAPRELPPDTHDHLVLIGTGGITDSVIRRADAAGVEYVLIEPDRNVALELHDRGHRVMVGDLDSPETYEAARVGAAALVATTRADTTNTNIAFTVREISETVPIIATASAAAAVDVLELAGCDQVLQMGELLGQGMARRVLARNGRTQVIGEFGPLRIAEANPTGTDLVGKTLAEAGIRARCQVHVAGLWENGTFHAAGPTTRIEAGAVLVLAGTEAQLAAYDVAFADTSTAGPISEAVIIGSGRVGRAAARVLGEAGIGYRIVEQRPERIRDDQHYVLGDASELEVLEAAGLHHSSVVVITTHDDDVNVYLTIYCQRLEPDIHIISRANLDRNVATLHRAGADSVLSYSSLGAVAIWNSLGLNDTLVLAEGLEVFRVPAPKELVGRSLAHSAVREATGCTVLAVAEGDEVVVNPDPTLVLDAAADLILISDPDSEDRFFARYPVQRRHLTGAAASAGAAAQG